MLVGCIITYNDMPLIVDCVNSLLNKVDKIVCVDGRYVDYPGDEPYSTDGTIEYLKSIDKVDLILVSGATEVEKRNLYLTKCNDGDIVLNLDSDEVLVGSIPELKTDFGVLDLHDGHSRHVQRRATRFFKFREGMKYENVHYTLYYRGKIINKLHQLISSDFTSEHIKGCYILHNWHKRSHLRQHNKSIYYRKLIKKEAGFTK